MFLCCVLKDFIKAWKGFWSSFKVKNGKMSLTFLKLLKGMVKIYTILLSNDAVVYRFEQCIQR